MKQKSLLHSMAFGELCGVLLQRIAADLNESVFTGRPEPYVVTCTGASMI
jgi:hypothetical protein